MKHYKSQRVTRRGTSRGIMGAQLSVSVTFECKAFYVSLGMMIKTKRLCDAAVIRSAMLCGIILVALGIASSYGQEVLVREGGENMSRDTIAIVPRSDWRAKPAKPYRKQIPVQITVHHEGGKVMDMYTDAPQRLRNIQSWCMGPDRNWADIPYHLLIAPDGTVYEGRDPMTVGESNTDYDTMGHLHISFLGNYNEQKLDSHLLSVLIDLLVDVCIRYDIPPTTIATHRDRTPQTTCPGEDIYAYFESGYVVEQVIERLQHDRPLQN